MSTSQYEELDKLVKEYEMDIEIICSERLIIKNYPKVFIMSAASMFERYIKDACKEFIDNPKLPIDPNYPNILRCSRNRKPVVDQMFAKLEGYDANGIEHLDAENFYEFFGGSPFEARISQLYSDEKNSKLDSINQNLSVFKTLSNVDDKYIFDYVKNCDLKDELEKSSFKDAENAYLSIKLRRNRVSHDYINGLSDTFADIQKFYNIAVIYVISLEKAIKELINNT